tara:strand:- start:3921 stop:4097 length:177 start_codon:yes stop_codon:yes gene_type:complete
MKPYEEGVRAFRVGNLGNPYAEYTRQNKDWEMGFNKAYFYNLERVKLNEEKTKDRRGS